MAGAGLTRRAALALLVLGGCARLRHGPLPDPSGPPLTAPFLRVAIFELRAQDIPFHAGLIVHGADEVLLFDPAGYWRPDPPQCQRQGQVFRAITPEVEAGYLSRQGIIYAPGGWVVHVLDIPVPAATAARAASRALDWGAVAPLHCAHTVSTLLSELPGFEGVRPGIVTRDLLNALLLREDVTYTRRDLHLTQSG